MNFVEDEIKFRVINSSEDPIFLFKVINTIEDNSIKEQIIKKKIYNNDFILFWKYTNNKNCNIKYYRK